MRTRKAPPAMQARFDVLIGACIERIEPLGYGGYADEELEGLVLHLNDGRKLELFATCYCIPEEPCIVARITA